MHQLLSIGAGNARGRRGYQDAEGVVRGASPMIRIMTADKPALTTITVDGQLKGEAIQQLETSCDQARSHGKPILLYLRDVAVFGDEGQALLRRLVTKGVRLTASGLYTTYVVQSIQPQRGTRHRGEGHGEPKR